MRSEKDIRTWKTEWLSVRKKEILFRRRHENKKQDFLESKLEGVVPAKLQGTLDKAFAKAFETIFKKGTALLEKTYDKETIRSKRRAASTSEGDYAMRAYLNNTLADSLGSTAVSGLAGTGMGLLGIGLPDIPVFVSIVLRNMYTQSLHFGYDYTKEKEQYFILLIIRGAVSDGALFSETEQNIHRFISNGGKLPEHFNLKKEILVTSKALSSRLLYMKFVQMIPLVGAIGGIRDLAYTREISEFGRIKYQKRYLLRVRKKLEAERDLNRKALHKDDISDKNEK